ncbi:MAG TPA: hypothetical protein VFB34_09195 [Chloroflexota bacterium]|nr:hypothetical protein [Chloroflexota bacterium]
MTEAGDSKLIESLQALQTRLDAMSPESGPTRDGQERREASAGQFSTRSDVAEAVGSMAARTNRIEDEIGRVRDLLTTKIDRLSELIAGFTPRLMNVEVALAELRAGTPAREQVDGVENRLADLSTRVDQIDENNNTRTSGLSTQINAWLVSLIGLVIGALVAYSLLGHH